MAKPSDATVGVKRQYSTTSSRPFGEENKKVPSGATVAVTTSTSTTALGNRPLLFPRWANIDTLSVLTGFHEQLTLQFSLSFPPVFVQMCVCARLCVCLSNSSETNLCAYCVIGSQKGKKEKVSRPESSVFFTCTLLCTLNGSGKGQLCGMFPERGVNARLNVQQGILQKRKRKGKKEL